MNRVTSKRIMRSNTSEKVQIENDGKSLWKVGKGSRIRCQ